MRPEISTCRHCGKSGRFKRPNECRRCWETFAPEARIIDAMKHRLHYQKKRGKHENV